MKRFTLTADHLKLLQRAYVSWDDCEYGAPAIDCKRPYGNSLVEWDICEILGWHFDDEDGPTRLQRENAANIHRETQTALQVVLATQSFAPGVYVADEYSRNWRSAAAPRTPGEKFR